MVEEIVWPLQRRLPEEAADKRSQSDGQRLAYASCVAVQFGSEPHIKLHRDKGKVAQVRKQGALDQLHEGNVGWRRRRAVYAMLGVLTHPDTLALHPRRVLW